MSIPNASHAQDHDYIPGPARAAAATGTPGPTFVPGPASNGADSARGTGRNIGLGETTCDSLQSLFDERSFRQHFQPDSTILLHGAPAEAIYMVMSGTVRCCTIDDTGRRQIFSFATSGDVVGLSDFDQWHFTAEAVDHVILRSVPRATFERALAANGTLRTDARRHVRALLERREQLLLSLASTTATERLLRFLERFAAARSRAGFVTLPMPRRDIADHLGMSLETVSRAFGSLKSRGLIDLRTHEKYRILAGNEGVPSAKALPAPGPGLAARQGPSAP